VAGKNQSFFLRDSNTEIALKKLEQIKARYQNQLCGEGTLGDKRIKRK
jgi:hypothetical protein